jgi:hypothetical protein
MRLRRLQAEEWGETYVERGFDWGRNSSVRDLVLATGVPEYGPPVLEEIVAGDVLGPDGEVLATAEDMRITLDADLLSDLERFDELPRPLRWVLHETIIVWRAEPFTVALAPLLANGDRLASIELTVQAMRMLWHEEMVEQREFGAQHRLKHGYRLPHLAARATIQRYGQR